MKIGRFLKALFLIGTVHCRYCRRQISIRALTDSELRELLMDDVTCTGCAAARSGGDPWKITFVVDT